MGKQEKICEIQSYAALGVQRVWHVAALNVYVRVVPIHVEEHGAVVVGERFLPPVLRGARQETSRPGASAKEWFP